MRTLRTSDTLHLILKQPWFGMIASGEKTEEYRELTPYWVRRLLASVGYDPFGEDILLPVDLPKGCTAVIPENIKQLFFSGNLAARPFRKVNFGHGYHKGRSSVTLPIEGITIGRGRPEWGAPRDRDVFIISLGGR